MGGLQPGKGGLCSQVGGGTPARWVDSSQIRGDSAARWGDSSQVGGLHQHLQSGVVNVFDGELVAARLMLTPNVTR